MHVSQRQSHHIESLTAMNILHQLILDPAHLLPNSSSIDLISKDQPNFAVDNGEDFSLHSKCHYQIIHCSFNLMTIYPLSGVKHKQTQNRAAVNSA